MNTIELAAKLQDVTYAVEVFCQDEHIGAGSAVAFTNTGHLLTAAHVVVRLNKIVEDLHDPDLVVIARNRKVGFSPYYVGLCAPQIFDPDLLRRPLTIDLAVLIPAEKMENVPFLNIRETDLSIGEPVMMAGFPDEVQLPFSFDEALNQQNQEVRQQLPRLKLTSRLLLLKSGIVGNKTGFNFKSDKSPDLSGEILYLDNVMHSGASGGPVVTADGKLAGIITQRAITRVPFEETPNLKVPSGSCVAITPRALLPFI